MEITGKLASSNLLVRRGMVLDTVKKCYRITEKILGLFRSKSACRPLPVSDYILMFRTLYAKCEACSIEDFEESSTIQLSLVHRKNRRLIVHESKDLAEVKKYAIGLASELGLKIRDSATDRRNPVWLRPDGSKAGS